MAKRRGLGRSFSDMEGMNSLLGVRVDDEAIQNELKHLSPSQLIPNPDQPRTVFDDEALDELAESIRTQGILQPLLVRTAASDPNQFEIIAGERRWRASQKLNLETVPCLIRDVSSSTLELALIENIQREDLTAIELANSYDELIRRHSYTQEILAEKLGINRATIANTLRLRKLTAPVQQLILEGELVEGAARQIVRLRDPVDQLKVARFVVEEQTPVRQVEKLIDACERDGAEAVLTVWKQTPPPPKRKKTAAGQKSQPSQDPGIRQMQESIEQVLGTAVSIKDRGARGGSIRIDYYTHEDFERIFQALTGKMPQA